MKKNNNYKKNIVRLMIFVLVMSIYLLFFQSRLITSLGFEDETRIGVIGSDEVDIVSEKNGIIFVSFGDGSAQEKYRCNPMKRFIFFGMNGNDVVNVQCMPVDFNGMDGDDIFEGSPFDDTADGEGGDDFLDGKGGNDILKGGKGSDTLIGGSGNDKIYGGEDESPDQIFGGDDSDIIYGGGGEDEIKGDDEAGTPGDDEIWGEGGADNIFGGPGTDRIKGGSGNDQIHGGLGGDYIWGEDDRDTIEGDAGNDEIRGGRGNDLLFGDTISNTGMGSSDTARGDDKIFGEDGDDILYGGPGRDTLCGGLNRDTIYGEGGSDKGGGEENTDSLYMGGDPGDMGEGHEPLPGSSERQDSVGGCVDHRECNVDYITGRVRSICIKPKITASASPSPTASETSRLVEVSGTNQDNPVLTCIEAGGICCMKPIGDTYCAILPPECKPRDFLSIDPNACDIGIA